MRVCIHINSLTHDVLHAQKKKKKSGKLIRKFDSSEGEWHLEERLGLYNTLALAVAWGICRILLQPPPMIPVVLSLSSPSVLSVELAQNIAFCFFILSPVFASC